jgi:hypothetical protein
VLGTPPAFVLSQDQTLREELHKESSTGLSWQIRPYAHCREPDVHRGLPGRDGVNLGTAVH